MAPCTAPHTPGEGWLCSQLTNHPEEEKDLWLAPAVVGEPGNGVRAAVRLEGVDEAGEEEVEAIDGGCQVTEANHSGALS